MFADKSQNSVITVDQVGSNDVAIIIGKVTDQKNRGR